MYLNLWQTARKEKEQRFMQGMEVMCQWCRKCTVPRRMKYTP